MESYCKAELKLRRQEKEAEKGEKDEPGEAAEEKRAPCGASPSF